MNAPLIGGANDDPFFAFRDELELHVEQASGRFTRWKQLLDTTNTAKSKEFKDETTALKKELLGLQSSATDLEQVLQRVQTHRSNFSHISDSELTSRQSFIREIKNDINSMKSAMSSPRTLGKIDIDARDDLMRRQSNNSKLETEMSIRTNEGFMEQQQQQQSLIMRQQDDHLDELEQGAERLGHIAKVIGTEIEEQNVMLDELQDDVSFTAGRMEAVLGKMDKMLKSNDRCQTWTILTLLGVLVLLIFLVSYS